MDLEMKGIHVISDERWVGKVQRAKAKAKQSPPSSLSTLYSLLSTRYRATAAERVYLCARGRGN